MKRCRRRRFHVTSRLLALLGISAAAGCTSTVQTVSVGEAMYPAPPATPRVQYLASFTAQAGERDDAGETSLAEVLFGSSPQPLSRLTKPYGLAARDGKLYVCDVAEHDVFVFDFETGRCVALEHPDVRFAKPVAIRFREDGNLEICDAGLEQVFVLSPEGQLVSAISGAMLTAKAPSDEPAFKPVASCPGPNGTSAVLNAAAHRIDLVDTTSGNVMGTWSGPGSAEGRLFVPVAMAASADGVLVSDLMNRRLQWFDKNGEPNGVISGPGGAPGYIAHPKGLAVADDGVVYVVDAAMHIVQMFDTDGTFLMSFGGPEPEHGGLIAPAGICVDRSALPHFEQYLAPDFSADYLIFVANQIGPNRISVYAFGRGPTPPVGDAE